MYSSDNVHCCGQGTGGAFYPEGWQADQPAWSRSRIIDYGMGVLTAYNASVLGYEFTPLHGKPGDQFLIVRQ